MLTPLIAILSALVAGLAVYAVMHRMHASELEPLKEENARLKTDNAIGKADLDAQRRRLEEQEKHYREMMDAAKAEFESLAQKVLDARSEKLKQEGKEQLKAVVDGLAKDIEAFRNKVRESDLEAAKQHTELKDKIAELVGQTNAVTAQAGNLADAIRGEAQLTGEWGEIQLGRVLECAGIAEGTGYTRQDVFLDPESGRKSKRTDFIIRLPEGRNLVIDSKSTLESAACYHAAKTEEDKQSALAAVIASVEKHIDEIVAADYPSVVPNCLPVTLMYIPVDEVYIIAMRSKMRGGSREPVREYASRHNIAIVNSASVVPVARIVEMLWDAEKSRKNTGEIISAAQELLRRCNAFVNDFMAMGEAFEKAALSYADAKAKLVDAPGGRSIPKAAAALIELGGVAKTKAGKPLAVAKEIAEAK